MSYPILFILMALVTFRVGRFVVADDLWEGTREKLLSALDTPEHEKGFGNLVKSKLQILITCPWCVSIWISAGTVFVTRLVVGSMPLPVWTWLGVSALALVPWEYTDGE